MIYDEELKRFHDWLQAKGEHPSVVLTLRWISEFELYAEEDEEEFREIKALIKQRSGYDGDAATALKVRHLVRRDSRTRSDAKAVSRLASAEGSTIPPRYWHGGGSVSSERHKKRIAPIRDPRRRCTNSRGEDSGGEVESFVVRDGPRRGRKIYGL